MTLALQKNINICSDPILKDYLAQRNIEAWVFDTILSREEKTAMLESLEGFTSNWFLTKDDVDYTEYRNVSIGTALHDELRTLFHLLIHFIFVIDKLGSENKIIFYHSGSCLMPNIIIEFLMHFNVSVKLADEKYPWLSYKKQLNSQAISNFSRISFGNYDKEYSNIRSKLGEIKLALKQVLSRIFCKLLKKSGKNIYLHANRSLVHFYNSYLNEAENRFGIYITDTTPLESKIDKKNQSILKDTWQLLRLARKGVVLDSLKCPFYYKGHVNYKKKSAYRKLVDDFCREFSGQAANYLNVENKALLEYFAQTFSKFYLAHLIQFMKLIDFYYGKFNKIKPNLCLQEMCHPFQAQVLASIGIPCRIYPSNHIIHNQYFAPHFFKKVKHFIRPVAFSNLDAERFNKLGFTKENIQILGSIFFNHWRNKITPFHRINSLKEKKILIPAPSIIALNTFRYQVQSEKLYNFFSDVFEVLAELQVSSVTIRPHPGANVPRNQFGYTDNDILKYLVDKVENKKKCFKIIFSGSYFHNLEEDILDNDVIIANMSGTLFEALVFGRDYVYFDDTITPHYGTKDWSIFNEGTIKRLRTREELRNHLINYSPPDLESLRKRLFGAIFSQKNSVKTLDPFTLL